MKTTRVINFYGGPSSGKSTAAAGLFYKMKMLGYSVELTDEFAKECVWEGNVPMLKDQLWVLAHQHRKILRLKGQVDYVITDSPVLLSPIYRELYDGPLYSDLILKEQKHFTKNIMMLIMIGMIPFVDTIINLKNNTQNKNFLHRKNLI